MKSELPFVADDVILNVRQNASLTVTVVPLFESCHLGEIVVLLEERQSYGDVL